MAGWPDGRTAGWPDGWVGDYPGCMSRMAGWARVALWPGGRMAGWPGGRMAGWPDGRVAGGCVIGCMAILSAVFDHCYLSETIIFGQE